MSEYSSDRYPGSKQLRRAVATPAAPERPDTEAWDAKPVIKTVRGQQVELFTVGQLGMALGRAAVTMRLWERNGVLPGARMRLPNKNGIGTYGRRYYTRPQVEGIARIASEEGLLKPQARLTPEFTKRVVALFRDLEK